jgi:hypothetical protein
MTSLAHRGLVHLGMDVSKDSISVAILAPDRDLAVTDKISSDAESVRSVVKRVGRASGIWACYEAGPTGYDLYRLLTSTGVRCDVVAPSLVPKGRGPRRVRSALTAGGMRQSRKTNSATVSARPGPAHTIAAARAETPPTRCPAVPDIGAEPARVGQTRPQPIPSGARPELVE